MSPTIADIFDALTSPDRPYKKSVPLKKVLAILQDEAAQCKLDSDLVELLIERRLFEKREAEGGDPADTITASGRALSQG